MKTPMVSPDIYFAGVSLNDFFHFYYSLIKISERNVEISFEEAAHIVCDTENLNLIYKALKKYARGHSPSTTGWDKWIPLSTHFDFLSLFPQVASNVQTIKNVLRRDSKTREIHSMVDLISLVGTQSNQIAADSVGGFQSIRETDLYQVFYAIFVSDGEAMRDQHAEYLRQRAIGTFLERESRLSLPAKRLIITKGRAEDGTLDTVLDCRMHAQPDAEASAAINYFVKGRIISSRVSDLTRFQPTVPENHGKKWWQRNRRQDYDQA